MVAEPSVADQSGGFLAREKWQERLVIVGTARDAANLLEPILAGAAAGTLAVLHLDAERRKIAIVEFAPAADEAARLPVREILTSALALDSAGIVVAHRLPGRDPQPSRTDIQATRRLAEAAANLDIRLHDRLVIAGGACCSFRELGLL